MKLTQYITIVLLCISGYALSGCSDNNSLVGSGMQPEGDFITIYTDTFQITASTVKVDSLYAKTTEGLLGEFYDPLYGYLKSDYLCQFYCQDGYTFRYTPYEGKIDSISLFIHYTYIGDPQASMQIQAYSVTEPLNKVYYTHFDPKTYCDMQTPLGRTVFTPTSGIVSDSTTQGYVYVVEVRLPVELGQKIYDETINNPSSFANQTAFNQFFPGIYVTTDYGSGSMLRVQQTSLSISYNHALKDVAGNDSLDVRYEYFRTTREVIQLNRVESQNDEQLLVEDDDYTYLKTPAGIFTRLVFPAKEIASVVEGRMLNNLAFSLKYMPQEDWIYSLTPSPQLLLIPEDSLTNFFRETNTESIIAYLSHGTASLSSSTVGYDASTRTYNFGNIVNLMAYHIQQNPDEDLRVLVIPVYRETTRYFSNNTYVYTTTSLNHYFAPTGVKLRKDAESMKMVLISSKYANK